jgi:hypothetical protein
MSGFLGHLAGIALGRAVEGAARPSLPARYAAPEADGPAPAVQETTEQAVAEVVGRAVGRAAGEGWGEAGPTASTAPAAARPPIGAPPRSDRGSDRGAPVPGKPPLLPASEAFARPVAAATERRARRPAAEATERAALPPQHVGHAPSPRRRPGPAEPTPIKSFEVSTDSQTRSPVVAPPAPEALPRSRETGPVRVASVQAPRRQPPRSAAGPTPSAPLSDGAVAGRAETHRPPAPVIHVTIDRIDVRAPAPPRPAPPARRAPAEPSLSLSDFLAAGSPRPRP